MGSRVAGKGRGVPAANASGTGLGAPPHTAPLATDLDLSMRTHPADRLRPPGPSPARPAGRRRAPTALLGIGLVVAGLLAGVAVPVAAQEPPTPTVPGTGPAGPADPAEPAPLGPLPVVAPELAAVAVTSDTYDVAAARRDRLVDERTEAIDVQADQAARITFLTRRDGELTTEIDTARSNARYWEAKVRRLSAQMRELAVSSYISGAGGELDPVLELDADAQQEMATQDVLVGSLTESQLGELRQAGRNGRNNRNIEQISTAIRDGVRDGIVEATVTREQAKADEERLAVELLAATRELEGASRLATVDGADFPLVVLDAYWKASRLMAVLDPACGIPWWALAGIGKTESRHGTYAGSEVRPDGSLTKPIVGIPLTGGGGTAFIGDSDGGLIDGDATIDRAAGPMQFIPQTWQRWGRDGDANGEIQIQNIYDAAAGAAAYLCASGPMVDDAGISRGYFSYNHSLAYVDTVLGYAKGYAESVEIPPVG